jgi:hypothetical protein
MIYSDYIHIISAVDKSKIPEGAKSEIGQLIKKTEIIYDSENDSGTDVKPFKTAQPGQDDFSEIETPMGLGFLDSPIVNMYVTAGADL